MDKSAEVKQSAQTEIPKVTRRNLLKTLAAVFGGIGGATLFSRGAKAQELKPLPKPAEAPPAALAPSLGTAPDLFQGEEETPSDNKFEITIKDHLPDAQMEAICVQKVTSAIQPLLAFWPDDRSLFPVVVVKGETMAGRFDATPPPKISIEYPQDNLPFNLNQFTVVAFNGGAKALDYSLNSKLSNGLRFDNNDPNFRKFFNLAEYTKDPKGVLGDAYNPNRSELFANGLTIIKEYFPLMLQHLESLPEQSKKGVAKAFLSCTSNLNEDHARAIEKLGIDKRNFAQLQQIAA